MVCGTGNERVRGEMGCGVESKQPQADRGEIVRCRWVVGEGGCDRLVAGEGVGE